jgi:hypothetical protein
MTERRRETPYPKRRGVLSARALGFAQGDEYSAAAALRDEPGELSPHARRLSSSDRPDQGERRRERRAAAPDQLAGPGGEAG